MRAAMVLCAGLGTRLRPLTDWLAKPMVPIGETPAVDHIATRLRSGGFERLVVNVFHRPAALHAWAATSGVAISEESELLGTAGGVEHAASLLGSGDVLVWNGDILSELDPRELVASHEASNAAATLAVVPRAAGEGNVGLGRDGRIVRLRKEAFGEELGSADFIGVHVIGAQLRTKLPPRGCLVGDVYIPALREGAKLATHFVGGDFIDVGSLPEYLAANRKWLAARGVASWAAEGAIVAADIAGSVVGAGARIDADAIRSVIWPGAHVRERVESAVVTPQGVVLV
jgi:mannose-1-phosphate guanylyltransferase